MTVVEGQSHPVFQEHQTQVASSHQVAYQTRGEHLCTGLEYMMLMEGTEGAWTQVAVVVMTKLSDEWLLLVGQLQGNLISCLV